jgi:hypothetical protein
VKAFEPTTEKAGALASAPAFFLFVPGRRVACQFVPTKHRKKPPASAARVRRVIHRHWGYVRVQLIVALPAAGFLFGEIRSI